MTCRGRSGSVSGCSGSHAAAFRDDRVDRTGRTSNRSSRIKKPGLLDLLLRCHRELGELASLVRHEESNEAPYCMHQVMIHFVSPVNRHASANRGSPPFQREKRVQAHYASAISFDLLKREQDRIDDEITSVILRLLAVMGSMAAAPRPPSRTAASRSSRSCCDADEPPRDRAWHAEGKRVVGGKISPHSRDALKTEQPERREAEPQIATRPDG